MRREEGGGGYSSHARTHPRCRFGRFKPSGLSFLSSEKPPRFRAGAVLVSFCARSLVLSHLCQRFSTFLRLSCYLSSFTFPLLLSFSYPKYWSSVLSVIFPFYLPSGAALAPHLVTAGRLPLPEARLFPPPPSSPRGAFEPCSRSRGGSSGWSIASPETSRARELAKGARGHFFLFGRLSEACAPAKRRRRARGDRTEKPGRVGGKEGRSKNDEQQSVLLRETRGKEESPRSRKAADLL